MAAGAAQASFGQAGGAPESQVEDPGLVESTTVMITGVLVVGVVFVFIGAMLYIGRI